mgnify:CR=1 FL=1
MKSDPTAPKRDGDLPRDRNAQKRDLSLTDQATRLVRDHILNLTLEPGVTLDERQVMERFQLGRTPMREAMNRLIAEGFVVRKDQRGIQVMPLDIPTAVELLDAYVMNERVVASMLRFSDPGVVEELREIQAMYVRSLSPANLAKVTEINTKFHNRLAQATQNVYIVDQSTKLNRLAQRLSYYIFRREATNDLRIPLLFDNPRKGHDLIIKHIENHDREMLVKELTDHATFFRTRLARIINEDRGKDINFVGLVLDF